MKKIKTASDARIEKNVQDGKQAFKETRRDQLTSYRKCLSERIEKEKASVKDCLDHHFFSIAITKIERIRRMTSKLQKLQS